MTELDDLQSAASRIQNSFFEFIPFELSMAIDAALAPAPVSGSPAAVRAQADAYTKASMQCLQVSVEITEAATAKLPAAWKGQVAENASQAIAALGTEVGKIESDLGQAAGALNSWAELLEWAQAKDTDGRARLAAARGLAGNDNPFSAQHFEAVKQAQIGVETRIAAFQALADQSPKTVSLLRQLTSQARVQDVTTGDLDPLSAVVLADTADPGGTVDSADILTPTSLTRASQRLDAMSQSDQAAFQKLLSDADSPQESAYLYKALAAGYNLQQIEAFGAAIHPHGADPTWLAEHLTPNLQNDGSGQNNIQYEGVTQVSGFNYTDLFNQGPKNDCVAASTVIAQASLDPVMMLGLTTGYGMPTANMPKAGDDSPSALNQRLQQIYQQEYSVGQHDDSLGEQLSSGSLFGSDSGIYSDGGNALANTMLSNSTGTTYQYQGLNSSSDRQAVLPQIEAAVDSGKPVPFQVTNGSDGHQMMIIGHNGDQLEVYNPWGFTQWVSESQFVNGDLGSLTVAASNGKPMPTPEGVDLPR